MFVLNHGAEASGLTNVALHKPTAQGPETWSETDYQSIPSSFQSLKAVDGVDDTLGAKCAHTVGEGPKWWLVDLLGEYKIYTVAVLNRDTFSYRLQNFTVEIGNQDPRNMPGFPETVGQICFHHRSVVGGAEWAELDCASGFLTGQFVRVVKWGYEHLTLCEVKVFGCRLQSLTRFQRLPNKTAQDQQKQFVGVLDNPAQCGMEIMQNTPFNAFQFNHQDARCRGYFHGPGLSLQSSDEWDTYVKT